MTVTCNGLAVEIVNVVSTTSEFCAGVYGLGVLRMRSYSMLTQ